MAFLLRNASRRFSGAIQSTLNLSKISSEILKPQRKYPLQMVMSPQQITSRMRTPWAPAGFIRFYAKQSDADLKEEEPTVERDTSSVANELREEFNALRKAAYDMSRGLLFVGLAHLWCGACIHWITKASLFSEACVQSYIAFAFPLTLALMVRRMMKPIAFFSKLEERGRLQILTLALQVTRGITALFHRTRALAILCGAAVSIGLLANDPQVNKFMYSRKNKNGS